MKFVDRNKMELINYLWRGKDYEKFWSNTRNNSLFEDSNRQRWFNEQIVEYARKNNLAIHEFWEFEGISGNAAFDVLFDRLRLGDTLIATDHSRLSRNSGDSYRIFSKFDRNKVTVIFVSIFDLTDSVRSGGLAFPC